MQQGLIHAIMHPAVIDAVTARFRHRRPFSESWDAMPTDQRADFENDFNAFYQACLARQTWLAE